MQKIILYINSGAKIIYFGGKWISSTATMVLRGSHRVVPDLPNVGVSIVSDTSMNSIITRITNSDSQTHTCIRHYRRTNIC